MSNQGKGWPKSIIGIFVFLSIMLFGILYVSLKYIPVNKENEYMSYYLQVDRNINDILSKKRLFDSRYDVTPTFERYSQEPVLVSKINGTQESFEHILRPGANHFAITVTDKAGNPVKEAKVAALLTRYETSEFDIPLQPAAVENGTARFEGFDVEKEGRWKLIVKATVGDLESYYEYRAFAR